VFEPVTLGTIALPSHPLMSGVSTFAGSSVPCHDGPIAPAATLVASLSNGRPLVATREPSAGRTALLGFYPPHLWDGSTDGARLMANALVWAAGCE